MAKITKVTAADGTVSYTEAETSLVDDTIAGVMAPMALASDDGKEFVSKRSAGIAALGYGAAGFLFGERTGHKRSAKGEKPFVGGAIVSL